jgi:hypothetical protein
MNLLKLSIFLISFNAFAGHGVERGNIKINDSLGINSEIISFMETKLQRCTLSDRNEEMKIEKVETKEIRVDQGIIDVEYNFVISYDVVRNDVNSNTIKVKVVDSDYDNWRNYSDKLSLDITYDQNNFCN